MISPESETITFTIDGKTVVTEAGQTILQAALAVGVYIPNLCDLKGLDAYGGCRLCLVKIEGQPGLPAACTTLASEGMVVANKVEEVNIHRRTICEMLLADHSPDCHQDAVHQECRLQRLATYLGMRGYNLRSTFQEKPVDTSNPAFVRDLNHCILCGRCVRTCQEVVYSGTIDIGYRGMESRIITAGDGLLADSICTTCGCCIQACPTGALKAKEAGPFPEREVDLICPYCGVGCILKVGIHSNRIVRVRGKEKNTPNQGLLCVKGRFGLDYLHSDDRLTTPLIRKDGELQAASWEEALDYAADKLTEIMQAHGSNAIGCLSSAKASNEENYAMMRFARGVIGTNNIDHCARLCHSSTVAGLAATLGSGAMTNSMQEAPLSDVILLTGTNTTWCHPVFGGMLKQAVKAHGVKLIVVDPRVIELADYADIHLQQRHGSDVVWLMGLQHIIIREGWHDADYIAARCEGWKEYQESLAWFTPEKVAELSGINEEMLYAAARLFATSGRGAIYYGMGITQHSHGVDNVKACANLALITGNLGFPGGGVNPLRGQANVQGACDMGALPNVFSGYQKVTDKTVIEKFATRWGLTPEMMDLNPGQAVTTMVNNCGEGIKAFYIMGENPMLSDPNINHLEVQLQKLELLIVQDIFLTETAQLADVVFPSAAFAEKTGTYTNTERRVQLAHAALTPPPGARQDYEIIASLAGRIKQKIKSTPGDSGKKFPATPEALFEEMRELTPSYHGISYSRLTAGEDLRWPCPEATHPGTPILHIESFVRGKGLLSPLSYRPPAEEPDAEYPFRLSTGRLLQHFHTGTMSRRSRVLDELVPHGEVDIHPADAARHGFANGELLRLATRRGEIETYARITTMVAEGSLFIAFHFAEAAANRLTNDALDPEAKIPEYKICAARIEKLT